MTHITELPQEVITSIGLFLTKRDILISILTCNALHQSLSHLLWKDITLQTGNLPQPVSFLQQNASRVQRLHIFGAIPPEYCRIVFPGLSSLKIQFKGASPKRRRLQEIRSQEENNKAQEVNNMALVRLNPTIRELTVHLANYNPSSEFWEAITTTLQQPKTLRLSGIFDLLGGASAISFWVACTRFEEISCHGRDGLLSDQTPPILFPGLDRMTLGLNTAHSYITNTVAHLEWLKKCPNLTRMRWELAGSQFPCDQFAEALQQSTWQRLESLCLTGIQESDQDLAIVMQELPSLTSFEMDACSFGPKCFAWLQVGQFAMIKTLHLRECIKLSSLMTLDILHSCHLLEDLEAFHVALSDLSSNPQQWVCRGLRRLRLYFDNDTNAVDFSWTVFGHLSGLVMLEDLDVDDDFMWEIELVGGTTLDTITTLSTPAPQGLQKRGPPLQWCLNSGLTQLIHLRRLRTLRVEKTFNTARAPDIKWMLEHWPLLQELTGPLVRDDCSAEEWEEMARMLKARGVENHNILFSSGAI